MQEMNFKIFPRQYCLQNISHCSFLYNTNSLVDFWRKDFVMDRNVYEACRIVTYYHHPTQDTPSARFWNQAMDETDTLSWEQWIKGQQEKGIQALYFVTESSANGREALSLPNVTPAMVVCCYQNNTSAFWTLRESDKGTNVLEEHQWSLPADSFSFPFHSNTFLSSLTQAQDLAKQLEFPYYETLFRQAKESLLASPTTNLFHLDPSHAALFDAVEKANVFYPGSSWMTEVKEKAIAQSLQTQYNQVSDHLLSQLRQALMAAINDSALDFSVEPKENKIDKSKKKRHWFSRKKGKAKGNENAASSHLSTLSPVSVPDSSIGSLSPVPFDSVPRENPKDCSSDTDNLSSDSSDSVDMSSNSSESAVSSIFPSLSFSLSLTPCPDEVLRQISFKTKKSQENKTRTEETDSSSDANPIRNHQIPSKKAQSEPILSHPQESSSPRLSEQASEEVKRILEENHAKQSKERLASNEKSVAEPTKQKIREESEWLEDDELPDQFDSFYLHPEESELRQEDSSVFHETHETIPQKSHEAPISSLQPEVPLRVKEPHPKRITSWVGVTGFWLGLVSLIAMVVVRFLPININLVLATVMETVTALCFAVFSVDLYLSRRVHQKWLSVLALLLSILCIGTTLIQGTAIVQDFRQKEKTAILDTYSLNYHPGNSEQKSYVLNGLTKNEKHYQLRINGRQAKSLYGAHRIKVQFYSNMKIATSCQKLN